MFWEREPLQERKFSKDSLINLMPIKHMLTDIFLIPDAIRIICFIFCKLSTNLKVLFPRTKDKQIKFE